ncbi:MAG: hypothetical protein M8319_06530 [Nitrosopumilus sp.]|nr:hypothetical protein [Nitrosopumilus sp.]
MMEDSEIVKRDHQRNKSEIVKLVKEMFKQDKWGDQEYKKKLQELTLKDEELVADVIKKIKLERG